MLLFRSFFLFKAKSVSQSVPTSLLEMKKNYNTHWVLGWDNTGELVLIKKVNRRYLWTGVEYLTAYPIIPDSSVTCWHSLLFWPHVDSVLCLCCSDHKSLIVTSSLFYVLHTSIWHIEGLCKCRIRGKKRRNQEDPSVFSIKKALENKHRF